MENRELLGKDPAYEMLAAIQRKAAPLITRPWPEVVKEIMQNTGVIMMKSAGLAVDQQSKTFVLPTAAFGLSAYRILSKYIADKEKVLEILADAVAGQMNADIETYLTRRFGITQDAPEMAYEMSRTNFKKINEEQFGRAFIYEQENHGDNEFCVNVRKCFFQDFLSANDASEILLPVSCMQDEIWIKELNNPKYKMSVSRPSILSQGSDACRFKFTRKS